MTDNIAACPHSLAERETAVADGMCPICSADALSRRSTPSLPDAKEQAKELCNWILGFLSDECSLDESCVSSADRSNVENAIVNTIIPAELPAQPLPKEIAGLIERHAQVIDVPGDPLSKETIVALRALAQENERLKNPTPYRTELRRNQRLEERIRELKTENERLKQSVEICRRAADKLVQRRLVKELREELYERDDIVEQQESRISELEKENDRLRKNQRLPDYTLGRYKNFCPHNRPLNVQCPECDMERKTK